MIKTLLASNSFWVLNKALVKQLGLEASAFISVLADKHSYHQERNELVFHEDNFYFYATSKYIQDVTGISYKRQKGIIHLLEGKEAIKTCLMGVPAKLYFTICEYNILQMVNHSIAERSKLELPKGNNIYKEQNTNNKEVIEKKEILFDKFWNLYDKKTDTTKSKKKFMKLEMPTIETILAHVPKYVASTPDKVFRKNPLTYLNGECWNDEVQVQTEQKEIKLSW